MSSCSRHASREAVGACINCGELVCAACHKEVDTRSYCIVCAGKLAESVELNPITSAGPAAAKPEPLPSEKGVVEAAPEPGKTVVVQPGVTQHVSGLWWLLPVFLAWVGGLAAWVAIKDKSPQKARNMLFSGVGISLIQGILAVILVFALCVPAVVNQGVNTPDSSASSSSSLSGASTQSPGKDTVTATSKPGSSPTIEVGPIIKTVPLPDVTLISVTTKNMQPSDHDQVVNCQDKLAITVPGGVLATAQDLKISTVQNAPGPPNSAWEQIAVYDISFSKQHEFNKMLTLELAVDTSGLAQDVPAERAVAAAYWDEANGGWVLVPATIDTQRNVLVTQTYHNGLWSWLKNKLGIPITYEEGANDLFVIDYYSGLVPTDAPRGSKSGQAVAHAKVQELIKKAQKLLKEKSEFESQLPSARDEKIEELKKLIANRETALDQIKNEIAVINKDEKAVLDKLTYSPRLPIEDYKILDEPPVVVDLLYHLYQAYYAYNPSVKPDNWDSGNLVPAAPKTSSSAAGSAGFKMPSTPIYVSLSRFFSGYQKLTGGIDIDYVLNYNATFQANACAHELFHAVQNQYYSIEEMSVLSDMDWWLESTCEYAAAKLARKGDFVPEISPREWLAHGLYVDSNEMNKRTCFFWDYLIKKYSLDFVDMFKTVATNSSERPENELNSYLELRTGSSLPKLFRNFAQYLLFDPASPYKGDLAYQIRELDETDKLYHFRVSDVSAARYQGILPKVDGSLGKRQLKLTVARGPLADKLIRIDIYKLVDNKRGPDNLKLEGTWLDSSRKPFTNVDSDEPIDDEPIDDEPINVTIQPGEGLYILATNMGKKGQSANPIWVTIDVADESPATLTLNSSLDAQHMGIVCTRYNFNAVHKGIPEDATYIWYSNEKEVARNSGAGADSWSLEFSSSGTHEVGVKATWKNVVKTAAITVEIGKPKLTIKGPKELKEGEKGTMGDTYTFWVEPENLPDIGQYDWATGTEGYLGTDRPQVFFKSPKHGKFIVKARYRWGVEVGCRGEVESLPCPFEIGEPYIDISASPVTGTAGQSTTFTATGHYIPQKSIFSWELGDAKNEGNQSVVTIDTPVSHEYASAGPYNVKVTASDKQGNKIASKQIQYQVIAQPHVVISPRPATAKQGDKITFSFKTFNMPDEMSIAPRNYWIFTYNGVQNGGQPKDEKVTFAFDQPGKYIVDVIVLAKDKDNHWIKGKQGEDWLTDSVSITVVASPTVTIIPPPEIEAGKGQPTTSYRFVAAGENVPENAIYTWYMDARELRKGESIPLNFSAAGAYKLKLVARWTDAGGQSQQAEAKLDLRISEPATTLPTGHGWYLVKTNFSSDPPCSQASCSWTEFDPLPEGAGNPLGESKPSPGKNQHTVTVSWTKLPSFLKPNSDFYCSVIKSPADVQLDSTGAISVMMGAVGRDAIYEHYYDLDGQQKIWIPDGSKATVPFFDESKLAGKILQINIRDFALFQYEYK